MFFKISKIFESDLNVGDQVYYKTEKKQERTTTTTKKTTLLGKIQRISLGSYDKIKKCSDCHPESSHTCKNSSRRTPRSKNLNFLFFVQITCFKLKAEGVGKEDAMVETATLRHCLGLKGDTPDRTPQVGFCGCCLIGAIGMSLSDKSMIFGSGKS